MHRDGLVIGNRIDECPKPAHRHQGLAATRFAQAAPHHPSEEPVECERKVLARLVQPPAPRNCRQILPRHVRCAGDCPEVDQLPEPPRSDRLNLCRLADVEHQAHRLSARLGALPGV